MTEDEIIDAFHKLFRGRKDALGTWDGGSKRVTVTRDHFARHLESTDPADWIGIYPMGKEYCSWGCVDIDGGDFPLAGVREASDYDRKDPKFHDWDRMLELATDLQTVLSVRSVHGHIERTRNGYHVWVFPEDPVVPAVPLRRALMAACKAIGYSPKEVFPKQERLTADQLGNYVRLPYYGWLSGFWTQPDRYFIESPAGVEHGLQAFLATVKHTTLTALEECAKLWTPPKRTYHIDLSAGLSAEPAVRKLNGLGYTIWRDGPLPGSDRSSTLAHLAHLCREAELSASDALSVVRSADQRHGRKFADRADGEQRLQEIIQRAWAT